VRPANLLACKLVLTCCYFAQGASYGLAFYVLMPTLAADGVELEAQVGVISVAAVPWLFKLVWGPLLDRAGARARDPRRWIAAGLLLMAITAGIAACMLREHVGLAWLALPWFLHNVSMSLSDVAADAFALDRMPARQRGSANGWMLAGHHVGAEGLGGLVLGSLAAQNGLAFAVGIDATLLAVVCLVPLVLVRPEPSSRTSGVSLRIVLDISRSRWTWPVLLLAAVVMAPDVFTSALSGAFWLHLQWDPSDVSRLIPKAALIGALAGYVFAAATVDRLGHAHACALGSIGMGGIWLMFSWLEPWWGMSAVVQGMILAQGLTTALFGVALHALLMDAVVPSVRATHFVLLTSLLNLPRLYAAQFAPSGLAMWGFAGSFAVAGVTQVSLMVLVLYVGKMTTTYAVSHPA